MTHYLSHYVFEIRLRGLYTLFAFGGSLLISYTYKSELFYLVSKPFLWFSNQFVFFELTEGFATMIRISGVISVLTLLPYMMYHVWSFVIPSSYLFERKKLNFYLWIFFLALSLEFCLMYWVLFPTFCEFFLSFQLTLSPVNLEFTPRLASYIHFTIHLFSVFLCVFQVPFIFVGLFAKNVITSYNLCHQRKLLFFCCILISAFLSPPDFGSQLVISSVFYSVFECIIFLGFIFQPFLKKKSL